MKKRIAVVAGGYSEEALVSLKSADMIMNNIDRDSYDPILVTIDSTSWEAQFEDQKIAIDKNDFSFSIGEKRIIFDGAFVIVHGTPGENGILQGYFELINMPHTTGDVFNMSLTFNKAACNDLLRNCGYNTAKNVLLRKNDNYSSSEIVGKLGLPIFVKPNQGGSSIATAKVTEKEAIHKAIDSAFTADDAVILEEFIGGKEYTVGVIMKEGELLALPVTEIISHSEFFDYEAKYEGKSDEITPADMPKNQRDEIQQISKELYTLLDCRGMIRVDFLMNNKNPFIIEVNTVPGFSEASIIPQQGEACGISKTELISLVIGSCF